MYIYVTTKKKSVWIVQLRTYQNLLKRNTYETVENCK